MADKLSFLQRRRAHWQGYRAHRGELARGERLGAPEREALVMERLRRTLVRAADGSPWYRERFRAAGFDPRRDLQRREDLAALPLLTKAEAREHRESMLDRRFAAGSYEAATSGTTGEPLRMRLNAGHLAMTFACQLRLRGWAGYRLGARVAALRSYVPASDASPLWRMDRSQNTLFLSAYHLTPANAGQYIERVLEFDPWFLRGYPSALATFADYAYEQRERFRSLRGLIFGSETLLPSERAAMERTFGNRLFDWYGMAEPAAIYAECEAHQGLHEFSEFGFSELLPGPDLGEHERRLVTTSFHNPVMPFIRYETGDVVVLDPDGGPCACGRTLPRIRAIAGRKDECLVTPSGRRLPSVNFYSVFRDCPEVTRFQIVQYGLQAVDVRVGLRPDAAGVPQVLERLRQAMAQRCGAEVEVTVSPSENFLVNRDGKTPTVVRRPGARQVEERPAYVVTSRLAWDWERQHLEVLKLDWNEADRVPCPGVMPALRTALQRENLVCWYPAVESTRLRQSVAAYAGVREEQVALTHGSDAGAEGVATTFLRPRDVVLQVVPSYDQFRATVEQRGARMEWFHYRGEGPFPVEELAQAMRQHTPRLVYLCNPNNPIGYGVGADLLAAVADACRRQSSLLLVDEAYFEFHGVSAVPLLETHPDLIISRTFSKAFGLAGLRLGYLLGSTQHIALLQRTLNPKHVTELAKVAAQVSLEQVDAMHAHVGQVCAGRERLLALLAAHGVAAYPSQANFVLLRWPRPGELLSWLESHRVLARDRTAQFAQQGHIRITVGATATMDRLLPILDDYFHQTAPQAAGAAAERAEGVKA